MLALMVWTLRDVVLAFWIAVIGFLVICVLMVLLFIWIADRVEAWKRRGGHR